MSETYLRLSEVHRHYGDGPSRLDVLVSASLEVKSGEIVALVAPSGAGKSTLLHLSGLLEHPQRGEIEICGEATSKLSERARTQMRRERVGYVYQFHHLLPEFSALENIAMPQLIAGASRTKADARARALLHLMGIGSKAESRPAELSGGEQQRIAIARAAANSPQLILADEPTGNLDPVTSEHVFQALSDLVTKQGSAALIATHNHTMAKKANRIVTIEAGRIVPIEL